MTAALDYAHIAKSMTASRVPEHREDAHQSALLALHEHNPSGPGEAVLVIRRSIKDYVADNLYPYRIPASSLAKVRAGKGGRFLRDAVGRGAVQHAAALSSEDAAEWLGRHGTGEESFAAVENRVTCDALLATLPPKERTAARVYFGLETGEPMSTAKTGKHLGISKGEATRRVANAVKSMSAAYSSPHARPYQEEVA